MSWECYCPKAIIKNLESGGDDYERPGSQNNCPYCGRERDKAIKYSEIKGALMWLDDMLDKLLLIARS